MKVVWLARAERDREQQIDYIAERNPHAAIRMGDRIEAAVSHLADHPLLGRPGRVAGTRELVVAGTQYVIGYRVQGDTVVILRLLHGAQKWPRRL